MLIFLRFPGVLIIILVELIAECADADIKQLGSMGAVAVATMQGSQDVLLF